MFPADPLFEVNYFVYEYDNSNPPAVPVGAPLRSLKEALDDAVTRGVAHSANNYYVGEVRRYIH
jgi:hypothetical protein